MVKLSKVSQGWRSRSVIMDDIDLPPLGEEDIRVRTPLLA